MQGLLLWRVFLRRLDVANLYVENPKTYDKASELEQMREESRLILAASCGKTLTSEYYTKKDPLSLSITHR